MSSVSLLFFGVSVWGALFTANALRPVRRRWPLVAVSFFPAWLTTELALHHLLWQAAATAAFVSAGALEQTVGVVGMAITLASWVGLGWLGLNAYRDGIVIGRALEGSLGPDFRRQIAPRFAVGERPPVEWMRVLMPFRMGHPGVERIRDQPYADDGHERHRLDIYRPFGQKRGAPVLVQIHGGAWMIGRKEQQGLPLMYRMASRGWVCVSINYRLSPEATWPDHLIDCKRALAWVRENIAAYGGDPDLVVVTGGSAGGHLAAMVALTANDPALQPGFEHVDTSVLAFVSFYGVFDWTDRFQIRGERHPMHTRLERYIAKISRSEDPELFEQASPMSRVGPDAPAAMILHGTADTIAPIREAQHFVELLRERSREPVVYAEFAGAHHAFEVFPSIRALHAINGVEAFAGWVVSRERQRRSAGDAASASQQVAAS